jgi:cellulose synthase (UDP-forming)
MFSEVMQSGRDTWDNAFCYGTCFVIKRACLEQVGGFPEDTICEDIHTSYVLLSHGHKTRFLNERLGSGLATQDITEFVGQRTRWCIGTLQCLFAEGGVLRAKRISLLDRVFFLDPVLHHLGALWTFCLLISPALYWWFGLVPFKTDFGHLLVVFAPRMLLTVFGLYWLSGRRTIPIVSELSRVIGIFRIVPAIFKVFANPFRQTFSTTKKSSGSTETEIRWSLMRPHLVLLFITLGAVAWRAATEAGVGLLMRENVGLMISLTLYVIWMLFFCCILCIQRPIPGGMLNSVPGARIGSMRRTASSLVSGVLSWK